MNLPDFYSDKNILNNILSCIQQAIIITDSNGSIRYANHATQEITGFAPDMLIEKPLSIFFTPDDLDCMYPNLFSMAHRNMPFNGEVLLIHKNQSRFFAHIVFNPANNDTIVISIQNINLQKKLEKLCSENKYQDLVKIAEGIAHELRNPLVGIGGFTHRLHKSCTALHDHEKYYSHIFLNLNKIEGLVKKVEDFSSLPRPVFTKTPISKLLENILDSYQDQIKQKLIALTTSINDISLNLDRELIGKAFSVLIENSLDALCEGGKIDVYNKISDKHCKIFITDSGCGISSEDHPFIFNPFFSTKPDGTGIDLAVVRRIMEDHMGEVSFVSESGHETTFCLTLPLERRRPIRMTRFDEK